MPLDPIARNVNFGQGLSQPGSGISQPGMKDTSPRHQGARSRSASSDNLPRTKSDGFRKLHAVGGDVGKQFEADLSRPNTEPPFGKRQAEESAPLNLRHAHEAATHKMG